MTDRPSRAFPHVPARTALAAALSLAAAGASADTALDASPQRLDTVVVTAAGFEQRIADAPASISVIGQEELQRKSFDNLAEALRDVEGVDIAQGTGKTGGLNISIRGMPSAYTLILIDGRRQNVSGDITPNGFGETSTSFLPPMSAIERIEVIRGPMSTLYGSDAMGGVVNIITKRVADTWGAAVALDHTFQEHRDYGATSNASVYASGPLADDLLGLTLRAGISDRSASDLAFSDGSTVSRRGASPVEGRTHDVGGRLSLVPNRDHDVYLDFSSSRQVYNNDDCQLGTLDGRGGNAVAGCSAEPNDIAAGYADELRFERDEIALAHRSRFGFGTWDSSLSRRVTETLGRTIPGTIGVQWDGFPLIGGAPRQLESTDVVLDTKLVAPLGASHLLTVGGQYLDGEVTDGLVLDTFSQSSWALFAEDEWRFAQDLALTFGGRYEDHDAFGGHFTPRAYLVWNANDHWTVKGGVAQGYKTPTLNQLHAGINGVSGQGTTITIGSPGLQPETSTNSEIGVYFDDLAGFNASLTVFQTRFEDLISSGTPVPNCYAATAPDQPGCIDFGPGFVQDSFARNVNIDEARIRGAEVTGRWEFAPDWSLAANYTYHDSEQRSGADEGAPLTNTPRHMAHASLNWQATDRLGLWLRGEHYGERERFTNLYENLSPANQAVVDGAGPLKAYEVFSLGSSFELADNVRFNAVVYNLLDKDFLDGTTYTTNTGATAYAPYYAQIGASTVGTVQDGRRLWLSVNMSF